MKYRHNCGTCEFIETVTIEGTDYEVYRCSNTHVGDHTWVARYGDEPSEYWSMPYDILSKVDPTCGSEVLRAVREIADRNTA